MIKCKLFDVVELNSKDNATILGINQYTYNVEIVDKDGITKGFKEISKEDVKQVIFTK